MRKIEENMRHAVRHGQDFRKGNTAVFYISAAETGNPYGARSEIYLHGNMIAEFWHETAELAVDRRTLARWPTRTTISRLRALGANVETRNRKVYLDGEAIN